MFPEDRRSNICKRLPQECTACIMATLTALQPLRTATRDSGNKTLDLLITTSHNKTASILPHKRPRVIRAMHFGSSALHLPPRLLRLRFRLLVSKVANGLRTPIAITLMNDLPHSLRLIMANLSRFRINNSFSLLQWRLKLLLSRFHLNTRTMSIAMRGGLGRRRRIAPASKGHSTPRFFNFSSWHITSGHI